MAKIQCELSILKLLNKKYLTFIIKILKLPILIRTPVLFFNI